MGMKAYVVCSPGDAALAEQVVEMCELFGINASMTLGADDSLSSSDCFSLVLRTIYECDVLVVLNPADVHCAWCVGFAVARGKSVVCVGQEKELENVMVESSHVVDVKHLRRALQSFVERTE